MVMVKRNSINMEMTILAVIVIKDKEMNVKKIVKSDEMEITKVAIVMERGKVIVRDKETNTPHPHTSTYFAISILICSITCDCCRIVFSSEVLTANKEVLYISKSII